MSSKSSTKARVTRHLDASPERVFDAWLDPAMVPHWFAPGLGEMARVDIDPREGGTFHLDQQRGEEIARHWGTYREIDRPRRLVFTWCVDGAEDEDVVEIDIEPEKNGSRVTIIHQMDARYADFVERTEKGWSMMLDGLAKSVG